MCCRMCRLKWHLYDAQLQHILNSVINPSILRYFCCVAVVSKMDCTKCVDICWIPVYGRQLLVVVIL